MSGQEMLSIGEVAQASGLRTSALRYYEQEGLIEPAGRRGGRRHYDRQVLARLGLIALCQDAGFTIAEIRTLLDGTGGTGSRRRWNQLAAAKLAELDDRIASLRLMRERLAAVNDCGCADIQRCDLVAGAIGKPRKTDSDRPRHV